MKTENKFNESVLKQAFTRSEVDEIVNKVKFDKDKKYRQTIAVLAAILIALGLVAILAIFFI